MKNTILITILTGSIILGGFYYVSQLNKQKSIENQQENQLTQSQEERCQKLANQRKIDMDKENPDYFLSSFEYHYNPNTKMCVLAYAELRLSSIFHQSYMVIDLFSGKEIFKKMLLNGVKEENEGSEWRHIADLYFYQKEVRVLPTP